MDTDTTAPEKKKCMLAALEKGMVMIHLDARRSGVSVPPHLSQEAHLRLNLSYNFDPPDLSVGEWGIKSTLSFSGKRFSVAVPWSALFAIKSQVTEEHWHYEESFPPELLELMAAEAAKAQQRALQTVPSPVATEVPRVALREVPLESKESVATETEPRPESAPEESAKPRSRSHLRVVK